MDKKNKKKTVIKRKSDQESAGNDKKLKAGEAMKVEESKMQVEEISNAVDSQVDIGQQIVHAGQIVDGNFEQPVFVNMKGEPVHLGPNTVIVYEPSGNSSNFAVGGMWTMDSSGRLVMGDNVFDVKGEPDDENQATATFVQGTNEVTSVTDTNSQYQQFEITPTGTTVDGNTEYEVAILDKSPENDERQQESVVMIENEAEFSELGPNALRWLTQKYEYLVRKLQLNYDAGVKLLHSQNGFIHCVYFTTPAMQVAFNAVPQFLCIDTSVQFISLLTGLSPNASITQHVCVFLAEDGNGKSVIVSAGISPFQNQIQWLLQTFKSCNPAYKQVRCVVAEPSRHTEMIREAFPTVHITSSVWQAASYASKDETDKLKAYAHGLLNQQQVANLKKQLPADAVATLESVLEPENYTNILHKGLERLIARLNSITRIAVQPDDFITGFFAVVEHMEQERRNFALVKLRETESQKHLATDTITQYAYNLMSHQTKLAQKCLDDKSGKKQSSAAICKYGTSTQECSCLFSKIFRLPCRHILMLTTELKVKTHIPFEPRWTVQHCLFGTAPVVTSPNTQGSNQQQQQQQQQTQYIEQIVVEENSQRIVQPTTTQNVVRQQQYVIASPSGTQQQVIFCSPSGTVPAGTVLQTVVPHSDSH